MPPFRAREFAGQIAATIAIAEGGTSEAASSRAEGLVHSSFAVWRPSGSREAGLLRTLRGSFGTVLPRGWPWARTAGPGGAPRTSGDSPGSVVLCKSVRCLGLLELRSVFITQKSATVGLGGPGRFRQIAARNVNKQWFGHRKHKVKYVMFRNMPFLGWGRFVERPMYCRGRPPGRRSCFIVGH